MKNASKHAETLKELLKKLTKRHKATEARPQLEPLRALVLGVLREDCDDSRADEAMERFDEEFVDVNELRVATELELADLMGLKYPNVAQRSVRLRDMLMQLFDVEGRLTVDRIAGLTKKEQRQSLRNVPTMTPFVEAHLTLLGFGQSALPVDRSIRNFLSSEEAIDTDADLDETQKFLEGHLKADECWPAFVALRQAALAAADSGGKKKGRGPRKSGGSKPAANQSAGTKTVKRNAKSSVRRKKTA